MDNIDYRADELANVVLRMNEYCAKLQAKYDRLSLALQKIAAGRGMIRDKSTIYMNGISPDVPKVFNVYDMREIAEQALKDVADETNAG